MFRKHSTKTADCRPIRVQIISLLFRIREASPHNNLPLQVEVKERENNVYKCIRTWEQGHNCIGSNERNIASVLCVRLEKDWYSAFIPCISVAFWRYLLDCPHNEWLTRSVDSLARCYSNKPAWTSGYSLINSYNGFIPPTWRERCQTKRIAQLDELQFFVLLRWELSRWTEVDRRASQILCADDPRRA